MTPYEKEALVHALDTLADPRGNWSFARKVLCNLAQLDPEKIKPGVKPPEPTTVVQPHTSSKMTDT